LLDIELETGKTNTLVVTRNVGFGIYLDGDEAGEILMPARYAPEGAEPGDEIEAFVYRDSEDRLIATTEKPLVEVGECALLKVQAVNQTGAFLDWGLPKDLLAPHREQAKPMQESESWVVYVYLDHETDRIAASSKLSLHLKETGVYFKQGQKVELMIASRSDLGFKAVINGTHLGLLFHSDLKQPLKPGDKRSGYIKRIRGHDQRIDLGLDNQPVVTRKNLNQSILDHLRENKGNSSLTDKSSPDKIFSQFGVSKGNYKKALGALYKQKKILIHKDRIELI